MYSVIQKLVQTRKHLMFLTSFTFDVLTISFLSYIQMASIPLNLLHRFTVQAS